MNRIVRLMLCLAAIGASGCSDDDASEGATVGGIPEVFSPYCTGVLKLETRYQRSASSGVWVGTGEQLPAGTTFLVTEDFDRFGGHVFLSDGTPAKVDADFSKGLVQDVDFTSTCAVKGAKSAFVLLARATLHADASLSGQPCVIEAGARFDDHGYSSNGTVATFQSTGLAGKCGFDKGYTKDMVYAKLLPK